MKLKDRFWIWGQDAMSHQKSPGNSKWQLPGGNRLEPVEGAAFLGVPNICRVVMNGRPLPPFDAESEKLRSFQKVVWSVMGDGSSKRNDDGMDDAEEVLRQASRFPNVSGGILDDFFRPETGDARMTPVRLREIADRFHNALNKRKIR